MKTIEEAKAAVERGETVHWKNSGYTLRKDQRGEWWVDCCNGFVTPLNGHKPEDFHTANDLAHTQKGRVRGPDNTQD
jgi:hypothetical protein